MTPGDMADVLTAAGVYDGRKIAEADVAAWHLAVGDLERDDALAAVVRHYGHSTDWLKPARLRQLCQDIRNERAAAQRHEVRALPSRFEPDPERDNRISRGIQQGVRELVAKWAVPVDDHRVQDPIRDAALHRARRERKGQAPVKLAKRTAGPGIQLEKVTTGPDWADAAARERASVGALHAAGRRCGRRDCSTCEEAA